MKYILALFTLALSCTAFGQISTYHDSTNCASVTVDLHASVDGAIPTAAGITSDDGYSGVIPIGFTFNFYGTNHTQCVIGSNGLVTFNTALAGAYCPWPISAALLGNASARNSICGPWCDIYPPGGGTITYSTVGVAPNRKFIVSWCRTRMYSCTTQWTTTQVICYETSNLVETHIAHKTICTWNGGYAIVGVQNAGGTAATAAPGRDFPSVWSTINESWRFTPVSLGTSYTVSSIPFAPIPLASSAIYWYDSTTGAYLGTGASITVAPAVPTTYVAVALGCDDSVRSYLRVNALLGLSGGGADVHISSFTKTNPTECGRCDGTIILRGLEPGKIDSVIYAFDGVRQPIIVTTAGLDSVITLTGFCRGILNYLYVKVGNCPSNQITDTLTGPFLQITKDTAINPSICGKNDGSIILYGLFAGYPVDVTYNKDGVPQPTVSGTVTLDSTFTIPSLTRGVYTAITATIGLCSAPGLPLTLVNPPAFPASFEVKTALGCNGDTVFLKNTSTPAGYYSYWNFGDGSPIDSMHRDPVHVFATAPSYIGSYNIVLTYNSYHDPTCNTTFPVTVSFDHHIDATITTDLIDGAKCIADSIAFTGTTTNTYSPSFAWNFGNGATGAGANLNYAYPVGGQYGAVLTVTDTIGCSAYDTAVIEVVQLEVRTSIGDTSVCLRDSMMLHSIMSVIPKTVTDVTYLWEQTPGPNYLGDPTSPNPSFFSIGDYVYTVTATANYRSITCTASDTEAVHSYPPITLVNITADLVIPYGESVQLNSDGAVYYTWTPNNGTLDNDNISNPVATPTEPVTKYTVFGMNLYGCLDSAEVTVRLDNAMSELVPSAFTPNGDGMNDVFRLFKLTYQKLVDFRVFNKWGQQVFQTANPNQGWDGTFNGTPQDMGVYHYQIIVARTEGANKIYKGDVTLIR